MPTKPKSVITVNSSVLSTHSVNIINATNVSVVEGLSAGSITTPSLSTSQLIVNNNDVTSVLQSGGNLNSNSATISGSVEAADIITNSMGIIISNGTLSPSPTVSTYHLNNLYATSSFATSPNPTSQVGFICVTAFDNITNIGSVGLYTRAKIYGHNFYTILMEKNRCPINVSLNTDTGLLTINTNSTTNHLLFEIKALNLFEK
jgi:hypothetical protein